MGLLLFMACPTPPPVPPGPPDPPSNGTCEGPRPTPLRLLTRTEYNNTVRDLLGDTTRPANAFPLEPIALSFDNNADILQANADLVAAHLEAAETLAATAVAQKKSLLVGTCTAQTTTCSTSFIKQFGRRVFRRELNTEELTTFQNLFEAVKTSQNYDTALEWTTAAMLQSPQFLYRAELGEVSAAANATMPLSADELASKMSYFIWASAPDTILLDAVAAGELTTEKQLLAQAERLLADPRATAGFSNIVNQLLRTDDIGKLEKDVNMYPAFTPAQAKALQQSLELFLTDPTGTRESVTMASLFTSNTLYVNRDMAAWAPAGMSLTDALVPVTLPESERMGLLSQPGLMARLAGPYQSSPIRRGIFVLDKLMCQPPSPPPANANIVPPILQPGLTTRERFAQHSADPACASCHTVIDPIGFGFERYDAIGKTRDTEVGKPIDTTGQVKYAREKAIDGPFATLPELSRRLSTSRQVHDCFASNFMRYALGRADTTNDACSVLDAQNSFFQSGGSFKALQLAIVKSASFRSRAVEVTP